MYILPVSFFFFIRLSVFFSFDHLSNLVQGDHLFFMDVLHIYKLQKF